MNQISSPNINVSSLKAWGWTDLWSAIWADSLAQRADITASRPARVLAEQRDYFEVIGTSGLARAEIKGRMRKNAEFLPTVGDWVVLDKDGQIESILPRQNCLKRKAAGESEDIQLMAANVDWIFITTSLNKDFNPRRIERFLVAARDTAVNGPAARAALVLTKTDLGLLNVATASAELQDRLNDIEVIATSSYSGEGIEQLRARIRPNETAVFLGTSGVGKSSLVNSLLKSKTQIVSESRSDDDKGRHTTTGRHSFLIPGGGVIIDSPGIRELQLADGAVKIEEEFEDVEKLALRCKFTSCRHESERGCAIRLAIEKGDLGADRLVSYKKLKHEIESKAARKRR